MIEKFNQFNKIEEKWGMGYIIPILISMGLVNEVSAQKLNKKQLEEFSKREDVKTALKNDFFLRQKIEVLEENEKEILKAKEAMNFLLMNNFPDPEKILKNLNNSGLEPDIKEIIMKRLGGSYGINIPKLGEDLLINLNLNKKTSINYGEGPFGGRSVGIKRKF